MNTADAYEWYARAFSERVLNWAIRKTGNRADGEDLAQEVFLQLFLAIGKREVIEKPEHFTWKVARYCWCNRLRTLKRHAAGPFPENLPDGTDFASRYADDDELRSALSRMRLGIANLNRLQRDMMVLHYLNGLSVREVASRLETTESAVTWHLFNARKQVREGICMEEERSVVYRPGRLSVGYSGEAPEYPDTAKVSDSLIRQNVCLLCQHGKTLDELVEATGVPKPFLEYDVAWLCEHEFLKLDGKRYFTRFLILNETYFANRERIYAETKKDYIDAVIAGLWEKEAAIREIGFYGSDFPAETLFWSIVMLFTSYCSRTSPLMLRLKKRDPYEIRPDGGRYFVMATDRSGDAAADSPSSESMLWRGFCGIFSDRCRANGEADDYYWLGVYTFADKAHHPEIVSANDATREAMHSAYCKTIDPDFTVDRLSGVEQEKLASAVEEGLIQKCGDRYLPRFAIFTPEQLEALRERVFAPLLARIAPQMEALSKRFFRLHKEDFPKASECGMDWHVYVDLWDFGIFTLRYAAEEGKLMLPTEPRNGVPLTLVMVK